MDLVSALKKLGNKMGDPINGGDLLFVTREVGRRITGSQDIHGDDLVEVVNSIAEEYSGGGGGDMTVVHVEFSSDASGEISVSNISTVYDEETGFSHLTSIVRENGLWFDDWSLYATDESASASVDVLMLQDQMEFFVHGELVDSVAVSGNATSTYVDDSDWPGYSIIVTGDCAITIS